MFKRFFVLTAFIICFVNFPYISAMTNTHSALTYKQRITQCNNPIAKSLLTIMEAKKSNLILAADLTSKEKLLKLADLVGSEICALKIHCDIINGFDKKFSEQLRALAQERNFLIWEDRKFADIGAIALEQYTGGVYRIADWADMVTVHSVAGDGTIKALSSTAKTKNAALLLIAQMSSANTLAKDDYTKATVDIALQHKDNVIGIICREKLSDDPGLLHFTPGVQFDRSGDLFGQQYLDPYRVIYDGSDIIIVGRGILNTYNPLHQAYWYRKAGWDAYLQRTYAHQSKL